MTPKEAKVLELSTAFNAATAADPLAARIPAPAPGVYENVPFHIYLKWDAISNSGLKELRRSPAHLLEYINGPFKDTDAMRMGRATHCAMLEPNDFEKRWAIGPQELRSNADKGKRAELELQYGPGHVLRPSEFEQCLRIRDGVLRYESARELLHSGKGANELSIIWVDPDTGVTCKARLDRIDYDMPGGAIVDLKSTEDASDEAFAATIWNYSYHSQGALYLGGAFENQIAAGHYVILAYEKEPPFGVGVFRLDEGTLSAGETQVRPLLALYRQCKDRNEWPCYPDKVRDISLPPWAWSRINAQEMGA